MFSKSITLLTNQTRMAKKITTHICTNTCVWIDRGSITKFGCIKAQFCPRYKERKTTQSEKK